MSHEILLENDKFADIDGQRFLESTNWDTLIQIATIRKDELACKLLPEIGLGYNHMVRILEFSDQVRWVAKLRMPHLSRDGDGPDAGGQIMESEYYTLQLVQKESNIPVSHVHMVESAPNSPVGAPFMLMDCLRANVGMDLSMALPSQHKLSVFASIAEVQIEMFNIRLPKIGKIIGRNDGSYRQGPIPGLGDAAGSFVDELSISSLAFNALMNDMVEELSKSDEGPFPLCHGDFGHNNMIFDDNYLLLGNFPLTLSAEPPAIYVRWNHDENGHPKDAKTRQRFADRELYIAIVRQLEQERGITEGYGLSPVLQDSQLQHLASAMRLYQSGNPGWYAKVLQEYLRMARS
ncbi:hypothetical protein BDV41DRAFT_565102 [Aspergillus transmontanensis]|uniref:Aminoglycoside phosphotransferase domain-containing protein n=1 Tax=Aspergillus transmontanensis TaxID=1034304 RepID=A0A5N6VV55_9EURO|nr:hypothetical protein BDV41DRAFT_565102 [Aspergillus transmontanensis]